ncbi:hypothetical protein [Bradyrhizobium ottawaense]|uniref:hypothetical protein n=1 Tax=Bradyrhizobium ottawaense TaxID=931866 RepID=UPI0035159A5C
MFYSLRPDLKIPFEQLFDGRFSGYDIEIERTLDVYDRPAATLTRGDQKVLVRTHDGFIERLIPTSQSSAHLIASVGCAYNCTFDQMTEDLGMVAEDYGG